MECPIGCQEAIELVMLMLFKNVYMLCIVNNYAVITGTAALNNSRRFRCELTAVLLMKIDWNGYSNSESGIADDPELRFDY